MGTVPDHPQILEPKGAANLHNIGRHRTRLARKFWTHGTSTTDLNPHRPTASGRKTGSRSKTGKQGTDDLSSQNHKPGKDCTRNTRSNFNRHRARRALANFGPVQPTSTPWTHRPAQMTRVDIHHTARSHSGRRSPLVEDHRYRSRTLSWPKIADCRRSSLYSDSGSKSHPFSDPCICICTSKF